MDLTEIQRIISHGEDGQHQFKEDIRSVDSLATDMVAFSNSKGGCILIGVSNQGALTGLSFSDVRRINPIISNAAIQHVCSPIDIQTENIAISADRVIIVLTIPGGTDRPYFDHNGVIWLKDGSDKRRVNSKEELRRLFHATDLVRADKMLTSAGIQVLNSELLADFLNKFYKKDLPQSHPDRLQLLENMNLANKSRLNLTALLLFGQKPHLINPQFTVKAICFPGVKIANSYLDSEDFEGTLPQMFKGALSFILRNLRKSANDLEIPKTVFEELLVNALIHRDYFISASIRLFVFDDRVEIISPGHLPDDLTVQKISAGTSIHRNPTLTSFIAKGLLPYQGHGTGVRCALENWDKIKFIDDRDGDLFTAVVTRPSYNMS